MLRQHRAIYDGVGVVGRGRVIPARIVVVMLVVVVVMVAVAMVVVYRVVGYVAPGIDMGDMAAGVNMTCRTSCVAAVHREAFESRINLIDVIVRSQELVSPSAVAA